MDVGREGDTLSEFQVLIFSSLISISKLRHSMIFGAAFVCDDNFFSGGNIWAAEADHPHPEAESRE